MYKKLVLGHFEKKGQNLLIKVPGPCVVMFKSTTCRTCAQFMPIFSETAQETPVKHYIVLVDDTDGQRIQMLSRGTPTNIMGNLPLIYFYNDTYPISMYKGDLSKASFLSFLEAMMSRVQQQHTPVSNMQMPNQMSQTPISQPPQITPFMHQPTQNFMPRHSNYATLGGDTEDTRKLSIPTEFTPHNTPWKSPYDGLQS